MSWPSSRCSLACCWWCARSIEHTGPVASYTWASPGVRVRRVDRVCRLLMFLIYPKYRKSAGREHCPLTLPLRANLSVQGHMEDPQKALHHIGPLYTQPMMRSHSLRYAASGRIFAKKSARLFSLLMYSISMSPLRTSSRTKESLRWMWIETRWGVSPT